MAGFLAALPMILSVASAAKGMGDKNKSSGKKKPAAAASPTPPLTLIKRKGSLAKKMLNKSKSKRIPSQQASRKTISAM